MIYLMDEYYIVISSNRPADQIVNHMNKLQLGVKFEVFEKDMGPNMYWLKDDVIGVTNQKAVGVLYVDDRGYRYNSLSELVEFIDKMNDDKTKKEEIKSE